MNYSDNSLVKNCTDEKYLFLKSHTDKILNSLQDIQKNFLRIAFLLYEVKEYNYYSPIYENIVDYSFNEFGFKKSQTYNFINVVERFGYRNENGILMYLKLKEKYQDCNFSQLCELLPLSDEDIIKIENPSSMSCKKIREFKQHLKDFNKQIENWHEEDKKSNSLEVKEVKEVQSSGRVIESGICYEYFGDFLYVKKNDIDVVLDKKDSLIEELETQISVYESEINNLEQGSIKLSKDSAYIIKTFIDCYFRKNSSVVSDYNDNMHKSKKVLSRLENQDFDLIFELADLVEKLESICPPKQP